MKKYIFFIQLLFSTVCFGQKTVIVRIYSIVTGHPTSHTSPTIRLDNKQLIRADTNGIFRITLTKRKVRVSLTPVHIYQFDTVIFASAISDTVRLFIRYPIDSSLADYDILHNQVQLFCSGGFAASGPMSSDKTFENKYSVKYHRLDCMIPDINKLKSYNQRVAIYLDTKYGLKWRQTARPDIFGVTRKI